ncbi:MAG TPA: phosphomannomutase [Devosiaceae bacterium]|jgi:phosphomannomutase
MADSLKFGTSGLRGLVTDLVGRPSQRYTLAFVAYLRGKGEIGEGGTILIGRDLRDSSPSIAASVIGAIRSAGLVAIDCGAVPTPALALEAMRLRLPAIMVTGSHIPADRNGLKFYVADGEIEKADELGIVKALAGLPEPDAVETPVDAGDPKVLQRYEDRYADLLGPRGLAGLTIGVYQHSTVARDVLVRILARAGAKVLELGRSDIFVPVDTEALDPTDVARGRAWAREAALDAIVSSDGDADRPLIADEKGAFLRGDVVGLLTARFLGADVVVTPVTSNSSIEGTGFFKDVRRVKVGSPYVIDGMRQASAAGARAVIGFEANGGVLAGSDFPARHLSALPTRDAVLPILAVLGLARQQGIAVSELVATLPPRFAKSDRLEHIPTERSAALIGDLAAGSAATYFADIGPIADVSSIDGLRFVFADGNVIHYRPSGNAPELRCYTEAATDERAAELLQWGLAAARKAVSAGA